MSDIKRYLLGGTLSVIAAISEQIGVGLFGLYLLTPVFIVAMSLTEKLPWLTSTIVFLLFWPQADVALNFEGSVWYFGGRLLLLAFIVGILLRPFMKPKSDDSNIFLELILAITPKENRPESIKEFRPRRALTFFRASLVLYLIAAIILSWVIGSLEGVFITIIAFLFSATFGLIGGPSFMVIKQLCRAVTSELQDK